MTDQDIKQQNEAEGETDNGNTAAADTAEKETNENPSSNVDVTKDVPEKDEKDEGDEKLSRSDKKKIKKLIKNGNMKKLISKCKNMEIRMVEDLENMM